MSMSSVNDRMEEATADQKDDGYIVGTVIDNQDPEGLGRVKVNVPNLFDPTQGDVPWIGPSKKSPFGIGSGYGVYGSPQVGSQVRIELQDGDAHYGLSVADEYTKANANAKFKDPWKWGFKDPSGNELFVDLHTQDWQFTHSSGLTIFINHNGRLTITTPEDTDVIASGKVNITSSGDTTITASGNVDIHGTIINLN